MAAQTPTELLQWLADNQFLPLPQVQELWALLPTCADQHALVKELVRRGWMTPYQANQILTDKAGSLVFGAFRILDRVGEGAMGQVFRAWNVRLGKFVAIKMLHANLLDNAKALDRFRQEMATASQLSHPHIVLTSDAGEVDDRLYMVMEYCEGVNLSQMVKKGGPLAVHQACDTIRQAAIGLQHAFERRVVHRDLKPSNLMLIKAGPGQAPLVKVLDFGLARLVSNDGPDRLTQIGNLLGTVDYIAPEQVENAQTADTRADIYSLGCTLFFLLTGKPPFAGTSVMEKVSSRLMGDIPDIRQLRPDVPAAAANVLRRMMAHKPADRFQTPAELAAALQPLCYPVAKALPSAKTPAGEPAKTVAIPVAKHAPRHRPPENVLCDSPLPRQQAVNSTEPASPYIAAARPESARATTLPVDRPYPAATSDDVPPHMNAAMFWVGGILAGLVGLIILAASLLR